MESRTDLLAGLAILATLLAALHVFFAATGGIADPPALSWLLALGTVAGAALAWQAKRRGRLQLAWLAFALIAAPLVVTWPNIGLSIAGLVVLALVAALGVGLMWETLRPRRAV